jgi:hypothetical protein
MTSLPFSFPPTSYALLYTARERLSMSLGLFSREDVATMAGAIYVLIYPRSYAISLHSCPILCWYRVRKRIEREKETRNIAEMITACLFQVAVVIVVIV